MKILLHLIFFIFVTFNLMGQKKLSFHTESVDSLLVWMAKGCDKNKINNFINQPANQIMEQLLIRNEESVSDFRRVLEEFNINDSISGNSYLINNAYKRQTEIANLLKIIKKTEFSAEVYNRVIKYFPEDYEPRRKYDIFFTAVGWKWGDAMSFCYKVNNGEYRLSNNGIPAVIFNLTLISSLYGRTPASQINVLKNVMSHELFHAVLSDYIFLKWDKWNNESIESNALFLIFNEGLAHYISDGKLLKENYNKGTDLSEKEKAAFFSLSDSSRIIFNADFDTNKRKEALISGVYGNYWNKYICITGLFMAYHIEYFDGHEALVECVEKGPICFFEKYRSLCEKNPELPNLPDEILKKISSYPKVKNKINRESK